MTRRRWIADEVAGDHAALVGEHAHHLVRVLRASIGQEFDIAAGNSVRRGRITQVSEDRVEFLLGEEISQPSLTEITLLLAVFKFDRMEWAIEKCTELGVARILPVITQRTDRHLAGAAAKRVERWQRIALQASEQSRRTSPPEIAVPTKLSDALNVQAAIRIVLAESEERTLFRDVVMPDQNAHAAEGQIALAVGPEGGWTEDELQSFQQAGWISASLGNSILRAETATIAATAIVAALV
jgi:16S rRNA (uracil1498-N3)-methyltransferase